MNNFQKTFVAGPDGKCCLQSRLSVFFNKIVDSALTVNKRAILWGGNPDRYSEFVLSERPRLKRPKKGPADSRPDNLDSRK